MDVRRTKALDRLDQRMEHTEKGSLRHDVLQRAKEFKVSWIELGRSLYAVWKEKLHKNWGYLTFDAYTAGEIGIRNQTALKLLRSYVFLEREKASYLKEDYPGSTAAAVVPGYESIDLLRRAKEGKKLEEGDYARIKKEVFENGKDPRELKKEITELIRQREELDPAEARDRKRRAFVNRIIGTLKSLRRDGEVLKLLPASLFPEIDKLIDELESVAVPGGGARG